MHRTRGEERTLWRIIALLVGLAALAEQAALRPAPVRFVVLLILRRAEAEAADLALEAAGAAFARRAFDPAGTGPVDALVLAARLRSLAAILAGVLSVASHIRRRRAPRNPAPRCCSHCASLCACRPRPPDTS